MSDSKIITPEKLRQEQCQKELNDLMNKYNVMLVPTFSFDGQNLNAGIRIMSKGEAVSDG